MATILHPIELGGETHHVRLTVPQLAELERKLNTPAGAILARLLQGIYLDPSGHIVDGSVLEAGFKDADITEVIFHGLVGGGTDALRARQLVQTYVMESPRKPNWLKAAQIMTVYMDGYNPPKKPEPPAATGGKKSRARRSSTTAAT